MQSFASNFLDRHGWQANLTHRGVPVIIEIPIQCSRRDIFAQTQSWHWVSSKEACELGFALLHLGGNVERRIGVVSEIRESGQIVVIGSAKHPELRQTIRDTLQALDGRRVWR